MNKEYRLINHKHEDRIAKYELQCYSNDQGKWFFCCVSDHLIDIVNYCQKYNISTPDVIDCNKAGSV